jgi:hypothetical protein
MLTLPVPSAVTTRYLVATDESTRPSVAHLRDILSADGLGRTARELLGSPLLTLDGSRAVDSPYADRLAGLGGGGRALRDARSSHHHVALTSIAAPAAQPCHAQAARLVARLVVALTGGVVVDLAANDVLSRCDPPARESTRFILGQEWLGTIITESAEQTIRIETAGLHRFGLPELLARDVDHGHLLTAGSVLRALSHRMLTAHWTWLASVPTGRTREIPPDQEIGLSDLLGFWGAGTDAPCEQVPVYLTPSTAACPECATALWVTGPAGRNDPDWWEDAVATLIPVR